MENLMDLEKCTKVMDACILGISTTARHMEKESLSLQMVHTMRENSIIIKPKLWMDNIIPQVSITEEASDKTLLMAKVLK